MGLLFGIFVGFAAAFTVDNLDRTVTTHPGGGGDYAKARDRSDPDVWEANQNVRTLLLQDKVKREVVPPANSGAVWMLTEPKSGASEAFRALRTSIMLSRAGGGPKIILVTSCIPGEGKTTVDDKPGRRFRTA